MAQRLVAALMLAHNAANAFSFPELLPTPTRAFNNIIAAAASATDDPAVTACAIAFSVVDRCASISGLTDAPEATQAACYCCGATTVELDEYYSSCADYISSNSPRSSTLYSELGGLASACRAEVPTCGVGAAASGTSTGDDSSVTGSPTESATGLPTITTSRSSRTIPPECTSLTDIVSSCFSATPSLTASTADDSDAASCLCYTTRGRSSTFTTELDDLATECAPWAKTAATTAYTAISALEGFCAEYSPTSTDDTPSETPTPTDTTDNPTLGGGSGPTTSARTTVTTTPRVSATTTSRTSSNPAAQTGAGGFIMWTANLMSLMLSFLFLV